MTVLFVLFVIVWGAARGFGEGIVWFQRAPQFHPWQGLYHGVRLCEYGLLFGAGAVTEAAQPGPLVILGALMLSWEAFEAAYLWARRGQADGHENVLGIYSLDSAGVVLALHIIRALAGVLFLWRVV